jgi:hypothetical protein
MPRFILLLLIVATGVGRGVWAALPSSDERGYDAGFAGWFRSLKVPGTDKSCCDASDCRAVEYRITPDGYEVHPLAAYDHRFRQFPRAEEKWTKVPVHTVLRVENLLGQAIACYSLRWEYQSTVPDLNIACFSPPSAV